MLPFSTARIFNGNPRSGGFFGLCIGGAALTCMELDGSVGSMMLKGKRFCDLDILDLREVQRSTYPTHGKSTSCKVKM